MDKEPEAGKKIPMVKTEKRRYRKKSISKLSEEKLVEAGEIVSSSDAFDEAVTSKEKETDSDSNFEDAKKLLIDSKLTPPQESIDMNNNIIQEQPKKMSRIVRKRSLNSQEMKSTNPSESSKQYRTIKPKNSLQKSSSEIISQSSKAYFSASSSNLTVDQILFKVPCTNVAWGTLYFYENSRLIFQHELSNYDPIKINADTIFNLTETKISNITDWQVAIGDGFILKKSTDDSSIVYMQKIDAQIKYKVYVKNRIIPIENKNFHEIYNGDDYFRNFEQNLRNLKAAYELADNCYLAIGIFGNFMNFMGRRFDQSECVSRETVGKLPYWFLLKLNTEYVKLDKQMRKIISNKAI